MEHITTTELRTKSSLLVVSLARGDAISLIHRSRIIGTIQPASPAGGPARPAQPEPIHAEKFRAFLKTIKPKKLIPRSQRKQTYQQNVLKKYGKNIS